VTFKRNKWFWMDATVDGVRYREPLKTRNWKEAKDREKARLVEIAQGRTGARGPAARQTFSAAADAYIEERALHSAEKIVGPTVNVASRSAKHSATSH
jgi:hypothetical protein